MFCPSCGTVVTADQKFCPECGASLVTATTLPPPTAAQPPTVAAPTVRADEPTAAFTVVEQTRPEPYEAGAAWDAGATAATTAMPVQSATTAQTPVVAAGTGFRPTPLLWVAVLAGVLAMAAAFVDVATYEYVADGGAAVADDYQLNDFSTNHLVGAVIAAVLMIGGGMLGATRRRVGTGLAGGAGLALAGMVAMMAGMVVQLFDAVEVQLLDSGGAFTLTVTYEVGFYLAVAAAVLGGVVFVLSLFEAGADGLPSITPAIGVLGALGAVAVAVGPLVPQHGASFGDNFSQSTLPPATLLLRLLTLLLVLVGGVLGFLLCRRWGLGLALGAISVGAWQWLTAITESGDIPLGIAGGNFFAEGHTAPALTWLELVVQQPHVVTTIGVVVMVVAGIAGLLSTLSLRRAA